MSFNDDLADYIEERITARLASSVTAQATVANANHADSTTAYVVFDGSSVAIPVKQNQGVPLEDHDRVQLVKVGAEWIIMGKTTGVGSVMTGEIRLWSTSTAPVGWRICDGSALDTTTYAALYAVIGTTYGGSGSTFNLPDLRGRVAVGRHSGQTEFDVLGETGGARTHTLTTSEMPSHTHPAPPDGAFWTSWSSANVANGSFWGVHPFDGSNNNTGSSGGGGAHNNLQPYITLHYIIKL